MKSYSFGELTEIGRKKHNLDENWHCFMAEVIDDQLRYGLSPKDKNGNWLQPELYDLVSLKD
ncbi:hypothetical protein [Cytobacillus horneckiae]|uniref:hypothetical protein n=1 Tax=Cytobacillus horneckiae TaxID=549687 RepID=UPI00203A86DF|nr:hypothetical protein [Cytobacillus horneckiae]MCM3180204.1 hypothetical protein [Cytobacillus horneckiae]